jgi:hypothetical protein
VACLTGSTLAIVSYSVQEKKKMGIPSTISELQKLKSDKAVSAAPYRLNSLASRPCTTLTSVTVWRPSHDRCPWQLCLLSAAYKQTPSPWQLLHLSHSETEAEPHRYLQGSPWLGKRAR